MADLVAAPHRRPGLGRATEPETPRWRRARSSKSPLPMRDLGLAPGMPMTFFVAVSKDGIEGERHPQHRPMEVAVPDERFEAQNWTA